MLTWNSSNDSLVVPARRANPQPAQAEELHFPDPIVAEVVFALESLFGLQRARVAELVRAVIDLPSVSVLDETLLRRALDVYEAHSLGFADAYLVAGAERAATTGGRIEPPLRSE